MPFATLEGLEIHYELAGNAGDPVVLVHGYMGAIEDFRPVIEALSAEHRVLMLDNRGHGASEAPSDEGAYRVERLVADVTALIARVGFERYHLVGHSVGGAVVQEIALASPERVLSLVLVDTTDSFAAHPIGTPPHVSPQRMRVAQNRRERMSKDALGGGWAALDAWRGSTDRVHRIEAPTLILYGERDASASIEGSRALEQRIPHAEVVVFEGVGHSPHFECPDEFNAVLLRFLSDRAR